MTIFASVCTILLLFQSCLSQPILQNATTTRVSSDATVEASPTVNLVPPPGLGQLNTLKSTIRESSSNLQVSVNYTDTIEFRGSQVNNFLSSPQSRATTLCAVFTFTPANSILILAAIPQTRRIPSAGTIEYFFQMQTIDENANKAICQQGALLSGLSQRFPGHNFHYTVKKACASCGTDVVSNGLELFFPSGTSFNSFRTQQLALLINVRPENPGGGEGGTCTNSDECVNNGFSCCLEGQCVRDRALRPEVDTTSLEYTNAINQIAIDPANIFNFPNLFFICPITVIATPTPTATPNSQTIHDVEFEKLQDLYTCTTPGEDELAVCKIEYTNASQLINAGTTEFTTRADDRNFNSTYLGTNSSAIENHSIVKVTYGGEVLYENGEAKVTGFSIDNQGVSNSTNDNLVDRQKVTVTHQRAANAPNDTLAIFFKVDGSCEEVNEFTARCVKYYIQSQNTGRPSDHDANEAKYRLPFYADLTKSIVVTVDGFSTIEDFHWSLKDDDGKYIEFIPFDQVTERGLVIHDLQKVAITYFVDLQSNSVMTSKKQSLDEIRQICNCEGAGCSLLEERNDDDELVAFKCFYPGPLIPDPPTDRTVLISSRSVPIRYYDSRGRSYDNPTTDSAQQEGNVFSYINGSNFRPSNAERDAQGNLPYTGFNEIYGSLSPYGDAKAPAVIEVQEGVQYDLFVNYGYLSTCINCGTDYYSILNKVFPANFRFLGGGYSPNTNTADRRKAFYNGAQNYRSDDLLFGRACFIPATMIPWSHRRSSSIADQRRLRLATQHFLFANGYQRDWFGFDYASLIGSFDGVTWFSIGNQRRIKARSNRLFLALNTFFGDLTVENAFSVTISQTGATVLSGSDVDHDLESDGAQCQLNHLCDTDRDCVTQLGWEYTCQEVTSISSYWPHFDVNAQEIPNTERTRQLVQLVGGVNASTKRCIYRGRGAPCKKNYQISNSQAFQTFTLTSIDGLHACSMNNYCQGFTTTEGNPASTFNTRIGRYAGSPVAQNAATNIIDSDETDLFGLGARLIGRPYYYNGTETTPVDVQSQLSYNRVSAICLPGRQPSFAGDTIQDTHDKTVTSIFSGDRLMNIGMTSNSQIPLLTYFGTCPTLRPDFNFYHIENPTTVLEDTDYYKDTATQNLSTNHLRVFDPSDTTILQASNTSTLGALMYDKNRCLKAAGSPCFSNLDCGPNKVIADYVRNLDENSASYNYYEHKYWSEELICGHEFREGNVNYDLKQNRCCRDIGQVLTIGTNNTYNPINEINRKLATTDLEKFLNPFGILPSPTPIETTQLGGVDITISSHSRNSRIATVYDDLDSASNSLTPPLTVSLTNACADVDANSTNFEDCPAESNHPLFQFETISKIAERTCCSKHWVRNFHENNGGGHQWTNGKMQIIEKSNFECLNYSNCNGLACSCSDPDRSICNARSLNISEAEKYSKFFSSLELLGIPQVLIKAGGDAFGQENIACITQCDATSTNCATTSVADSITMIPGTVKKQNDASEDDDNTIPEGGHAIPEIAIGGKLYYRADDPFNFATGLKQIFSRDSFTCCLPAGTYDEVLEDNECCTGTSVVSGQTSKCCLPAFTNVSVYLNKYVSSESRNLPASNFDPLTGALDPGLVLQRARDFNLCCSLNAAPGLAIESLIVPGSAEDAENNRRRRFITEDTDENLPQFRDGQRWNTDIYCVP